MKKLLGILVLGFILAGCGTGAPERYNSASGGQVKVHFSKGYKTRDIVSTAHAQCRQFEKNSKAINIEYVHAGGIFIGGEYDTWNYDCQKVVVKTYTYTTKKWTPYEESLWDKITSWFESDSGESAKDKKIKKLENEIKTLKSRGDTQKADQAQKIRDCLMADLEKLMCAGVD